MHKSLKLLALPLCLLFATSSAQAAKDDDLDELQTKLTNQWTMVKNDQRHGLKTFAKQEDGKRFRSFKVEATLDGDMASFVRMITGFEDYKKWSWQVLESKLLKKVSPTEYYFYVTHDAPYAVMLALQRMTEKEEYLKAKTPLPFVIYDFKDYQ